MQFDEKQQFYTKTYVDISTRKEVNQTCMKLGNCKAISDQFIIQQRQEQAISGHVTV